MKKFGYGWLLKWVLAAILIAVGIYFKFNNELVYLVTGSVIVIFSVFRVYSLLKTLDKEVQRTLNLIEIILSTILGVILIVVGVRAKNQGGQVDDVWGLVYRFGLVFIFTMRSIVYFYSTTFLEEKSEQVKFWTHILLLPLAGVILASSEFGPEWVGWLLLVISLTGGAYLIYDGTKGYNNYRNEQKLLNDRKPKDERTNKQIEQEKEIIIDKQDDERPYVS